MMSERVWNSQRRADRSGPRRLGSLKLCVDFMAGLLWKGSGKIVKHALPPDAKVVEVFLLDDDLILCWIESESFPEVHPGEDVPELPQPQFEIVD